MARRSSAATVWTSSSSRRCGYCSAGEIRRRAARSLYNRDDVSMSVYTTVTPAELDAWLARYTIGGLVELEPIASGIENTNYFVTTEKGRYVLTLYERLPATELPFYLNLM